jgi:hypothetical protein
VLAHGITVVACELKTIWHQILVFFTPLQSVKNVFVLEVVKFGIEFELIFVLNEFAKNQLSAEKLEF